MDEDKFIKIRHYLHQNPELSGQETATKAYIKSQMNELWPKAEVEEVGDTSLIFTLNAAEDNVKHLAFRCELDALPIQEQGDIEYRSKVEGVSHKCGHDGHMTILLRLAYLIRESNLETLKISLIFQSSEENGKGAKEICERSQLFKQHKPDYVFALHNVPAFPSAAIVVKSGVFTPAVVSVKTKFIGKTSHAAEPQKGINPSYAIAAILLAVKEQQVLDQNSPDMLVTAPVEINVGNDSYGTSAGEGSIGFTFRALRQTKLDAFKSWYESFVAEKCKQDGLRCEFIWFETFNSVINDPESVSFIRNASKNLKLTLIEKETPFSWGEDFGFFTELTKGAMFGLGSGENHPPLHSPKYDFPDQLIVPASEMFFDIIKSSSA